MNTKATANGPLTTRLREIEQAIEALRPQRTAGILTGRTTRGVSRRPIVGAEEPSTTKVVARWA